MLLSYGDISSVGEDVGGQHDFVDRDVSETTFYGRDRGETGSRIKPRQFRTRKKLLKCAADMGCEYCSSNRPVLGTTVSAGRSSSG